MSGFNIPMFIFFLLLTTVAGIIFIYLTELPKWAGLLLAPLASFIGLFAFGKIVDFVEGRKREYAQPSPGFKDTAPPSGPADMDRSFPTAPDDLTCPSCGGKDIAAILYGLPGLTDELEKAVESGRVTLGGCGIYDGAPEWVCNNCAQKFGEFKISEEVLFCSGLPDF